MNETNTPQPSSPQDSNPAYPMFLSKDRVKQIIQGAPKGTSPAGIVAGLREKGYMLEGYGQVPSVPTPQPTEQPSFLKKALGTIFGGFATPGITGTGGAGADVATGFAKSYAQVPFEVSQLGEKAAGAVGIPKGSFFRPAVAETPEALKYKSTAEQMGGVAGDISQFFIPGSAEAKAGATLDKLVDVGKLTERFGPEAAKVIKNLADIAGRAGITGASTAGVSAVQTGGDAGSIEAAGIAGLFGGAAGKALEIFGKPIANALQQSALKLSGAKQAELGSRLEGTVNWMTDNLKPGTPTSQYVQTTSKLNNFEKDLQTFLATDAKDITVKKSDFVQKLEDLKGKFSDDRDALAIDRQIDDAIKTINVKQPENIPVASLNAFKRSTYSGAWNKAGTKVLDWVESFIGNTAKEAIETATAGKTINGKPIAEFNAEYGNAIQAKNLLKIAKGKSVGLSGKALLLLLGSPAGLLGEAAGLVAGGSGGLAGALKTGVGAMAEKAGSTIPSITKAGIGAFRGSDSPPQQAQ